MLLESKLAPNSIATDLGIATLGFGWNTFGGKNADLSYVVKGYRRRRKPADTPYQKYAEGSSGLTPN